MNFLFLAMIKKILKYLRQRKFDLHRRHVSVGDLLTNRWETAQFYGFGEGASCYDNVLVLGDVCVGKNTWIGPNTILDGTGGLTIGNHVDVSAGSHIYSHDTVNRAISCGVKPIDYAPTKVGDGVFIGPNSVILKGVTIGDGAIIGAMSFVNKDVPAGGIWRGAQLVKVAQDLHITPN